MLLRQIEYLQSVIENGNFYLAAEKCHVSQSAISQQIKKLENELGIELLNRHNRTFSLTPAGEHFYRKSLVITNDLKQVLKNENKYFKIIKFYKNKLVKLGVMRELKNSCTTYVGTYVKQRVH